MELYQRLKEDDGLEAPMDVFVRPRRVAKKVNACDGFVTSLLLSSDEAYRYRGVGPNKRKGKGAATPRRRQPSMSDCRSGERANL